MAIAATLIDVASPTTKLVYTSSVTSPQTGNAITCIMICNTSVSTAATITLYAVPATGGGTTTGAASDTNMIINALNLPPGETVSLDQEKLVLTNNDTIVAKSSQANVLSFLISTLPV
jgi:hypothetical protein